MAPNGQVLQPVEILFIYFVKRTPDTPDGMVWGQMVWHKVTWYGVWHGIGTSGVWYGFSIPWYWYEWGMVWVFHSMVPWYWNGADIPLWNGYPQGTLNQGIDVPHRYPKMGDWSDQGAIEPCDCMKSYHQEQTLGCMSNFLHCPSNYWEDLHQVVDMQHKTELVPLSSALWLCSRIKTTCTPWWLLPAGS